MKRSVFTVLALAFCYATFADAAEGKGTLGAELSRVNMPGGKLAYVVMDAHTGQVLASRSPTQSLKPASIMKLITTYVALKELGPDFRFSTRFFGKRTGSTVKQLVFVGGGAPSFTMEDLWKMVRALRLRGVEEVKQILIDDTLFIGNLDRSGQRAYEAGTSAVSFNFNSLAVTVCAADKIGQSALLIPDPFELPVLINGKVLTTSRRGVYSVDEIGHSANALPRFRVSGTIGRDVGCESVYRSVSSPVSYVGATIVKFLGSVGIKAPSTWVQGKRDLHHELLYEHKSPPLSETVSQMNHFSNNFMADQLLFAISKSRSAQLSSQIGLSVIKEVIASDFPGEPFQNHDGSGLSHQNRVSARLITEVLRSSVINPGFGPEFISSLPVAGRNGTLKERPFRIPEGSLRAKTGTLNGVNSLAGLITTRSKKALLFTIISNGTSSRERALKTERELLERIYSW